MRYIKEFLDGVSRYPFHMPGHKRSKALFPELPLERDITEIYGADDLHRARGIIRAAQESAARLWGARRSYFLVNGGTCGVLAGITSLAKRGDRVLCARNCHRSVFHALEVGGLDPVFILPEYLDEAGVYGALPPEAVKAALDGDGAIRLVILVSPTYEGILSDVKEIAEICRERGVSLFVDEAHGAHLDLSPFFTGGAVSAGADVVVQSLHKTLPALTQTAILHVAGDGVDIPRLEHKLRVFETSSPSYLLLSSAEHAAEAAADKETFKRWSSLIDRFERETAGFKNIKLAFRDGRAYDRSKLVFTGVNGRRLMELLRLRGIEAEYADDAHLVAMTGPGDSPEGFDMLAGALAEADALLPPQGPRFKPAFCVPQTVCGIERALDAPSEAVPVCRCAGRTAAEYVWSYPPGIPVVIPGEAIPPGFPAEGAALESDSGLMPEAVKVLC